MLTMPPFRLEFCQALHSLTVQTAYQDPRKRSDRRDQRYTPHPLVVHPRSLSQQMVRYTPLALRGTAKARYFDFPPGIGYAPKQPF